MTRTELLIDYIINRPIDEWQNEGGLYVYRTDPYNFILKQEYNWDTDAGGTHDRHSISIGIIYRIVGTSVYNVTLYTHTEKKSYTELDEYLGKVKETERARNKEREDLLFTWINKQ